MQKKPETEIADLALERWRRRFTSREKIREIEELRTPNRHGRSGELLGDDYESAPHLKNHQLDDL
jgi:hypothetical protein